MENSENNYKLKDLLRAISVLQDDVDVSVDGTDFVIAVVGTDGIRMSPSAVEYFKDALELPVSSTLVMGKTDKDYEDYDENGGGRLGLACELLYALAGYCEASKYDEWFESDNARLL